METNRRRKFLIDMGYYVAIIGIVVFIFRYVIAWCLPFILGFVIAAILQGIILRLSNKLAISNRIVSLIVLTLFYVGIGGLAVLAVIQLIAALTDFFQTLPSYYTETIEPALQTLLQSAEDFLKGLNPDAVESLKDVNGTLFDIAKSIAPSISSRSLSYLSSFVMFIPSFLLSFTIMIISSYFFAMDYAKIKQFILLQFNEKNTNIIRSAKRHTLGTLIKFVKSYGIIMAITFLELSVGLMILGVENAIAIAFIIAVFDVLPVLGTGGIMIPWIVITFINGTIELAVGLLILYVVITIIRNIIEPKIVGVQVGAHPIIMLISMFLGVKLLGIFGIIALPVIVILVKNLNEEGVIHLYKNVPEKKESNPS